MLCLHKKLELLILGMTLTNAVYSAPNYEVKLQNNIAFCPPTAAAQQNNLEPDTFKANGLNWQIDFHGWPTPDKIGFMQAIFIENDITCFYQWTNPEDKSTKLWMTVKLSPFVSQKIKPYGIYWRKIGDTLLCDAGVDACAFKIE